MIDILLRSLSLKLKKLISSTFYSRYSEIILDNNIVAEVIYDYINIINLINVINNAYYLNIKFISIVDSCELLNSLLLILREISFI